jgi:uncharacterized membrane protein
MDFEQTMLRAAQGFEVVGVGVLVLGALVAVVIYLRAVRADPKDAFTHLRNNLGRAILLGLEILIVADIIFTVTVEPTITSAVVLGVIVLVRTFLSFSLEIELEGVLPWRRGGTEPPADL